MKKNILRRLVGIVILFSLHSECTSQDSISINEQDLQIIKNPSWEMVTTGLNFPEGPAWDGHSILYVSNCYGGWITRITAEKADTFLLASRDSFTFDRTNGLTIFKDGSLFACDFGMGAVLRISSAGKSEIFVKEFQGKSFNRPNDLAFDVKGNLFFTDPKAYDRNNPDGCIYRVSSENRQIDRVASQLAFPNGIAFSADGEQLYVCESAFQRIVRFKVQSNGTLADKEIFIELPGGDPDGIGFDIAENLYVAHFGGGAIYIIGPDGVIKQKIDTPGKKPTNLEFGGLDLATLFLTEVETNAIYKMPVQIPGQRLFSAPVPR